MPEQSMQEELLQQVLDQQEALKDISEMLAVEPSEQLQQVFQLCSQHRGNSSLLKLSDGLARTNDPVCSYMKSCWLDCKRRNWLWLSTSRQSITQHSQISLTAQCQLCSNSAGQLCALSPDCCVAVP